MVPRHCEQAHACDQVSTLCATEKFADVFEITASLAILPAVAFSRGLTRRGTAAFGRIASSYGRDARRPALSEQFAL